MASLALGAALGATAFGAGCASEERVRLGDIQLNFTDASNLINNDTDRVDQVTLYVIDRKRSRKSCQDLPLRPTNPDRFQQIPVSTASTNSDVVTDLEEGTYSLVVVGLNRANVPVSRACRDRVIVRDTETTEVSLSLIGEPVPIAGRYRMDMDFSRGFPRALGALTRVGQLTCVFLNIQPIGRINWCGALDSLAVLFDRVRLELEWDCRENFRGSMRCDVNVLEINGERAPARCDFFRGSVTGSTRGSTVYDTSGRELDIDGRLFAECLIDLGFVDPSDFGLTERSMIYFFSSLFGNGEFALDEVRVVSSDGEVASTLRMTGEYKVDAGLFKNLNVEIDEDAYLRSRR